MITIVVFLILILAFAGIAFKVLGAVFGFIIRMALEGAWKIFVFFFFIALILALI